MTIKPEETATIVVEGRRFDDWESVFVQVYWNNAFPVFRFTAAERDPIPKLWTRLQFKPGDHCAIYLGGHLAITGVILVRQTAYDANSHGVMLQGVGLSWYFARGSILHATGNFDDKTFEQVAREVVAPFGIGVNIIGMLNATPYARLQCEVGETAWNFLERIARPRGILLGSDRHGRFVMIGDHAYPITADLIEGHNILRCQATISWEHLRSHFIVDGQTAATDSQYGRRASEQQAMVPGKLNRYSPLRLPAEQPVWNLAEIADRAKNEAVWNEGDEIRASITVQGWLAPDGGRIWQAGEMVHVHSPMAMLDMALKIETATFTQDDKGGTLTTLDLAAPWLLKDFNWDVGNRAAPQPPGAAKLNQAPPQTPPAGTVPDPYPETLPPPEGTTGGIF